jgi:phosphatidylserine/phosphatidylglycerophosphate/cardiolipin synthase-like enzyme
MPGAYRRALSPVVALERRLRQGIPARDATMGPSPQAFRCEGHGAGIQAAQFMGGARVGVVMRDTGVTGSLNFSENADESNEENVVIVSNRDIAAQYLQEFERRWVEATEPDRAKVVCE